MYAPPPFRYARTVCRYEITTMAIKMPTATAMPMDLPRFFPGSIAVPASRRTSMISSVAYATDDNASEAKTGRARIFGRSWWWASSLANGRPRISRFSAPMRCLWPPSSSAHHRPSTPPAANHPEDYHRPVGRDSGETYARAHRLPDDEHTQGARDRADHGGRRARGRRERGARGALPRL